MTETQMAGFADELGSITKDAGVGSALWKSLKGGVKGFGSLGSKAGRSSLMTQAKALPGRVSKAYQHGGLAGAGKALARSTPVQMAAVGGAGLYGASKLVGRRRQPQQG